MAKHDEAWKSASEALTVAQEIGTKRIAGKSLYVLGVIEAARGNQPAAIQQYRAALDVQTETEYPAGEALTRKSLAEVLMAARQTPEALAEYQNAAVLFERIGNASAAAEIRETLSRLEHAS
jgi:tetratricopeptide (TPR) repeat protein